MQYFGILRSRVKSYYNYSLSILRLNVLKTIATTFLCNVIKLLQIESADNVISDYWIISTKCNKMILFVIITIIIIITISIIYIYIPCKILDSLPCKMQKMFQLHSRYYWPYAKYIASDPYLKCYPHHHLRYPASHKLSLGSKCIQAT